MNMCQIGREQAAIRERLDVSPFAALEPSPGLRLMMEPRGEFDLYQWAVEFSHAAGFAVETAERDLRD
jgi:hypothetical protein